MSENKEMKFSRDTVIPLFNNRYARVFRSPLLGDIVARIDFDNEPGDDSSYFVELSASLIFGIVTVRLLPENIEDRTTTRATNLLEKMTLEIAEDNILESINETTGLVEDIVEQFNEL